ncbi:efflux RND transporter periplasmic adaptor subunit [Vibrio ishigakensis]|uniref:efflux RND transporter periplasmic adaptor subunit n=1 Tax=Vibrio ishigakensis TaxID=1481914 RepID=UPI0021C3E7FE|nr:efflux RND transporter periplasmic adaptor subunit [Vibrio ishigakensis]
MKNSNLAKQKLRITTMALAVSLLLTGCESEIQTSVSEPVVRPVLVEVVSDKAVADLSFNGVIQSASRADLSFRASGRIIEMLVQEGDSVEKGQLIAKLDAKDAEIALTSARNELNNARSEFQRAKVMFEQRKMMSKSEFEEFTLRFNLAQNKFAEATRRLEDTNLKAPFTGVVSRTFVDNHVLVQSNEIIAAMHDLNDLEVVINVPDSLMTGDGDGANIVAQSTIAPYQTFNLELKKYETEPDPVTGTYAVTFAVDATKESRLLPGMNVHVFSDDTRPGNKAIQVPLTAVTPDNLGNQYVWVVDEQNILQKREVVTGSLSGERVQIEANLKQGENVVVSGTQNLKQGIEVRPELVEVQ